MTANGTLLPSAEAASCPQLAEGDIRALAEKSGFDPKRAIRSLAIGCSRLKVAPLGHRVIQRAQWRAGQGQMPSQTQQIR